MGKQWKQWETIFWAPKSLQMVTAIMKLKDTCSLQENYYQPRQLIKKQTYAASKGPSSQSYGFSSSHEWMWELDYKEGWVPKSLCFRTVVLQKTLEYPLDSKEIKPVNPKGNQPWIFSGRTDAKAEALIFWPPDSKSPPTHWKIPWCWERLRAGGDGDNRGWDGWMALPTRWTWVWASSVCWWWTGRPGVTESDTTEQLNWTEHTVNT